MGDDEELAKQLDGLCDWCNNNSKNEGYDLCQQCFDDLQATRGVYHCSTCFRRLQNSETCLVCAPNFPSETASYEELLEWERSRNAPNDLQVAIRASIIESLPKLSASNDNTISHETCGICLGSEKEDKFMVLPCMHIFHYNCCAAWLKQKLSCPICQREVKLD